MIGRTTSDAPEARLVSSPKEHLPRPLYSLLQVLGGFESGTFLASILESVKDPFLSRKDGHTLMERAVPR